MNEYLYEEQLKNERFEQLIQKEMLNKEEVDFVISWDEDQRDNFLYISEYLFLNLNKSSEHDWDNKQTQLALEKRNMSVNNPQITRMNEQLDELLGPKDMPGFEGTWEQLNDLCNV